MVFFFLLHAAGQCHGGSALVFCSEAVTIDWDLWNLEGRIYSSWLLAAFKKFFLL